MHYSNRGISIMVSNAEDHLNPMSYPTQAQIDQEIDIALAPEREKPRL
jgi:hypothetical protein